MPTIGAATTCSFACAGAGAAGAAPAAEGAATGAAMVATGACIIGCCMWVMIPAGRHAADSHRFFAFLDLDFGDPRFLE